MKFDRDLSLYARMITVLVILGLLYVGLAAALTLYAGELLAVIVAFGVIGLIQLYFADTLALYSMNASRVSKEEHSDLHARVQRLSQQAGVPKPDVAIANSKAPNAFAAGTRKKDAVVCVTEGLLDTLEDEELDAVLAHELAHIKHRDMIIMTVASFLSMVTFYIVRWGWLYDDGSTSNQHFLIAILASLVVWILSFFVTRLLSRYREYSADRGAAAITGNPSALATALRKISGELKESPDEDLRDQATVNALLFTDVETGRITRWFSTHPAVEQRVERLNDLTEEMH